MRGSDERSRALFSFVDLEERIPKKHPLGTIRRIADDALSGLSERFAAAYSHTGRPSIPPDRLLMERLHYDLLFRWFVGLGIDDPVWDRTV